MEFVWFKFIARFLNLDNLSLTFDQCCSGHFNFALMAESSKNKICGTCTVNTGKSQSHTILEGSFLASPHLTFPPFLFPVLPSAHLPPPHLPWCSHVCGTVRKHIDIVKKLFNKKTGQTALTRCGYILGLAGMALTFPAAARILLCSALAARTALVSQQCVLFLINTDTAPRLPLTPQEPVD